MPITCMEIEGQRRTMVSRRNHLGFHWARVYDGHPYPNGSGRSGRCYQEANLAQPHVIRAIAPSSNGYDPEEWTMPTPRQMAIFPPTTFSKIQKGLTAVGAPKARLRRMTFFSRFYCWKDRYGSSGRTFDQARKMTRTQRI